MQMGGAEHASITGVALEATPTTDAPTVPERSMFYRNILPGVSHWSHGLVQCPAHTAPGSAPGFVLHKHGSFSTHFVLFLVSSGRFHGDVIMLFPNGEFNVTEVERKCNRRHLMIKRYQSRVWTQLGFLGGFFVTIPIVDSH